MSDLKTQIKDIIATINITLDPTNIPDGDDIIKSQILDSFGFVDLIVRLEKNFGISIQDNEITGDNFNTIEKITDFVQKKIS